MKESEALVMLQDVDLKLMRERHALKQMPQVPKIEAVRAAKKKLASDYKKILGQLKDCQMDIEDNESDHVRMEDITKDVHEQIEDGRASYRTTRDLDLQLSALAKRIEKLEFTHKELERNLAKLQQAQKNALDLDHKLTQQGEALIEAYRNDSSSIRSDIDDLEQQREHAIRNLQPQTYERYQAAQKRFGGLAVETLKGNTPSICRVALQASSFDDIRRGPEITECQYCHRMLVTDGMFDDAEE